MMEYKIAETLKELRDHLGLTQEQVADQLHISRQTYSNYENGSRTPTLDNCCALAAFFKIDPVKLIFTGLHPKNVDPFASLPDSYREHMEDYHKLSLEKQAEVDHFTKYLGNQK